MSEPAKKLLSSDDVASVVGYVGIAALGRTVNPDLSLAAFSLLASGMLAVFWLAADRVRSRNRYPDARIAVWAAVAVVSGIVLATS